MQNMPFNGIFVLHPARLPSRGSLVRRSHMSAVHPSNVGYGQGNRVAEDEEEGAELLQDDTAEDADMNALIEELKLRDFRLTYCGVDMSKGECGWRVWLDSVVRKCGWKVCHAARSSSRADSPTTTTLKGNRCGICLSTVSMLTSLVAMLVVATSQPGYIVLPKGSTASR